jgi:hypothetical protein
VQPIVNGMPSVGQAVAGINVYELARTSVWVGAYAAVGFAIGETRGRALLPALLSEISCMRDFLAQGIGLRVLRCLLSALSPKIVLGAGWRYKRWLAIEPSTTAGFFATGAGTICLAQSTWNSMTR